MEKNDYQARNRAVARAYGITFGLRRVKARALARKDTPQWLIDGLDQALTRADLLIDPLIEFRESHRQE